MTGAIVKNEGIELYYQKVKNYKIFCCSFILLFFSHATKLFKSLMLLNMLKILPNFSHKVAMLNQWNRNTEIKWNTNTWIDSLWCIKFSFLFFLIFIYMYRYLILHFQNKASFWCYPRKKLVFYNHFYPTLPLYFRMPSEIGNNLISC